MSNSDVKARSISWFRASSFIFAFWAIVFIFFPTFTNERAGIAYVTSKHAEDWTRLVGLFSLAFSIMLNEAHRSSSHNARRTIARVVLAFTGPCALLMAYWQIIPDGRWFRYDLINVALLCFISYGMVSHGALKRARS